MKTKELLEIEIENIKTKEKVQLKDIVYELGLKDYFERKNILNLIGKKKNSSIKS